MSARLHARPGSERWDSLTDAQRDESLDALSEEWMDRCRECEDVGVPSFTAGEDDAD